MQPGFYKKGSLWLRHFQASPSPVGLRVRRAWSVMATDTPSAGSLCVYQRYSGMRNMGPVNAIREEGRPRSRWHRDEHGGVPSLGDDFSAGETRGMARVMVDIQPPPFLHSALPAGFLAANAVQSAADALALSAGSDRAILVEPVLDSSADLAKMARKGSDTLRRFRDDQDRARALREQFRMTQSTARILQGREDEGGSAGEDAGVIAEDEFSRLAPLAPREDDTGEQQQQQQRQYARASAGSASGPRLSLADLLHQRRELPIFKCRDELMRLIAENPVVVLVGETGSGKTTQLTQFLYEDGYGQRGVIGCTQPRRVAAMSVARRVWEEQGYAGRLGDLVGYTIRFEDVTSEKTRIKYMTDGVLLREAVVGSESPASPAAAPLSAYSAIIMDEAHERSLNTDVLFGILRRLFSGIERPDLRLIVTSATLEASSFASFFGGAPVFHIPGRAFPVSVVHSPTVVEDYVDAAVHQVLAIHYGKPAGDVLVFMTGQEDVDIACALLFSRWQEMEKAVAGDRDRSGGSENHERGPARTQSRSLVIIPMYSMLPSETQSRIFEEARETERKVVISTNIAETSLTVSGVKYVVDCGFVKMKVFNSRMGMDMLLVYPESQAGAIQRAGRAGRTERGECFRLFTEYQFHKEMLVSTMPEIRRTNLAQVILLLKSLGVNDVRSFDFMDAPSAENLATSEFQLWTLGALDHNSGQLTSVGRMLVQLPLEPALGKLLIAAATSGCVQEMLTIVAMLSVPPVFARPPQRAAEADSKRQRFLVAESDHLTLLNVYLQWQQNQFSAQFASDNFLHIKNLRRAKDVRAQLSELLRRRLGVLLSSCGAQWNVVRRCVCSAYFMHSARLKRGRDYVNLLTGQPCAVHPTSALFDAGLSPEYVVYHEAVLTQKEYMHCTTAVEAAWLSEDGPMFFKLRGAVHRSRQGVANSAAVPAIFPSPAFSRASSSALSSSSGSLAAASTAAGAAGPDVPSVAGRLGGGGGGGDASGREPLWKKRRRAVL